jgi:hypothetical protein
LAETHIYTQNVALFKTVTIDDPICFNLYSIKIRLIRNVLFFVTVFYKPKNVNRDKIEKIAEKKKKIRTL